VVKIYKIFYENDPNVVYIGQTSRALKERLSGHIYTAKKKLECKTRFYNWIRECGYENLKIFLIYEVEDDKGDHAEIEQIKWHRENGFVVKNQTEGGIGVRKGYKHTEEVCEAASKRNILMGKFKGEKNPFFGKYGKQNHKSIEVHQYSLSGEYIKSFDSINLAGKEFNSWSGRFICRACETGEIAYGYLWSTVKVEKLEPREYSKKIMEESDVDKCFELYQKGFNFSEIEKIIGFNRHQLTRKMKKKFGIDDKHKKNYMEESDIVKAYELYHNGVNVKKIHEMTGFSTSQIKRKLNEKYNLQLENYLIEEHDIAKAAKMYENGISFSQIHKEFRKEMKISKKRITKEIKKYLGIDKKN
jgi:hypothetical protein